MTRGASVLRAVLSALLGAAALGGCTTQQLNFFQDHRLHILSPRQASTLSLPVTVRWSSNRFRATGPSPVATPGSGYFAVLVDRNPMPPGASLRWFARSDHGCQASQGCPDQDYLAQKSVFLTTASSITFTQLPALSPNQQPRWHQVTIVLLDGTGRRAGESAFSVNFYLTRDKGSQ